MRGILPINLGSKIVGRAITVQTFAGDWAKPVEAIEMAGPGDVLVIYNGSNYVAPWGGLATLSSKIGELKAWLWTEPCGMWMRSEL